MVCLGYQYDSWFFSLTVCMTLRICFKCVDGTPLMQETYASCTDCSMHWYVAIWAISFFATCGVHLVCGPCSWRACRIHVSGPFPWGPCSFVPKAGHSALSLEGHCQHTSLYVTTCWGHFWCNSGCDLDFVSLVCLWNAKTFGNIGIGLKSGILFEYVCEHEIIS